MVNAITIVIGIKPLLKPLMTKETPRYAYKVSIRAMTMAPAVTMLPGV
jgi:hypothetical protein